METALSKYQCNVQIWHGVWPRKCWRLFHTQPTLPQHKSVCGTNSSHHGPKGEMQGEAKSHQWIQCNVKICIVVLLFNSVGNQAPLLCIRPNVRESKTWRAFFWHESITPDPICSNNLTKSPTAHLLSLKMKSIFPFSQRIRAVVIQIPAELAGSFLVRSPRKVTLPMYLHL